MKRELRKQFTRVKKTLKPTGNIKDSLKNG